MFFTTIFIICVLIKIDGRISDAFGRKTAYLFATVVFFVGSAMCGAANSLWTLVISRGILHLTHLYFVSD